MTFLSHLLLAAAVLAASPQAGLTLPEALEGHVQVLDEGGAVVLELEKRAGSTVDLGLAPGTYSVRQRNPGGGGAEAATRVTLAEGERRPLALEALVPAPSEPAVALGVFAHAGSTRGAALGLISTHLERDARWFQGALLANAAGGEVRGAQLSLGTNSAGGAVRGVQFSSAYNGAEAVSGAQLTLGVNLARGAMRGFQLGGLFNWAEGPSAGLQASVGLSAAPASFTGLQLGGVASWAETLRGAQLGLFNVAGDAAGLQLGAVNVARRLTGFQLALVNVADEARGAPFGLVNVIRDGQMHLEVFGSDLQPVNVAFKSGGKRFYTTLVAGGGRQRTFLYGFGAGAHLGGDVAWLDADVLSTTTLEVRWPLEHAHIVGTLRAVGGLQLGPVGLFAGPTLNVLVALRSDLAIRASYLDPFLQLGRVQLWPGLQVGARL